MLCATTTSIISPKIVFLSVYLMAEDNLGKCGTTPFRKYTYTYEGQTFPATNSFIVHNHHLSNFIFL